VVLSPRLVVVAVRDRTPPLAAAPDADDNAPRPDDSLRVRVRRVPGELRRLSLVFFGRSLLMSGEVGGLPPL